MNRNSNPCCAREPASTSKYYIITLALKCLCVPIRLSATILSFIISLLFRFLLFNSSNILWALVCTQKWTIVNLCCHRRMTTPPPPALFIISLQTLLHLYLLCSCKPHQWLFLWSPPPRPRHVFLKVLRKRYEEASLIHCSDHTVSYCWKPSVEHTLLRRHQQRTQSVFLFTHACALIKGVDLKTLRMKFFIASANLFISDFHAVLNIFTYGSLFFFSFFYTVGIFARPVWNMLY